MDKPQNIIAIFAISFLLAGAAFYQYAEGGQLQAADAPPSDFKPKAGYQAAVFELPDLEERAVSVGGGEDGKLSLVNFWASWCGPCVLEAPDLQELHEEYGDVMTLYGVNSTKYDREREARNFVEEYGFTFPVLMDRDGDATKIYKVISFPTSFIIDANGIIRERINGVITYEEWERLIKKWL